MLTWAELLGFYAANVVVWLGLALAYVYRYHESDEWILGSADAEAPAGGGEDG